MSRIKNACDISPKVREEVMARDGGQCVICGSTYWLQIAHYISRARLGLGIPQNLTVLCRSCHYEYDNGKYHKEIKEALQRHFKAIYPNWDENKLTYKKGNKHD